MKLIKTFLYGAVGLLIICMMGIVCMVFPLIPLIILVVILCFGLGAAIMECIDNDELI